MMTCNLTIESFLNQTKDGPLLDELWRCRICHKLAGEHPPITVSAAPGNEFHPLIFTS